MRPGRVSLPLACVLAFAAHAHAEDAAQPVWMSGITLSAQFEAGISVAPAGPKTNFGQLFTDRPNQFTLNQALITLARPTDPKAGWDVGFKLQGMFGADARYTHFLGVADYAVDNRYQFDLVEANVLVHMPLLTAGGIDFKAGLYSTPLGYETIDPSTNPFYTHSYIFNFSLPLKHTGALAVFHATPAVDTYLGIDTGANTTFGKGGDNNGALGGIFGFGLNLLDGNLTVLALTHIGPENPTLAVPNADRFMRYFNDAYVTWKATPALSFTTEANFVRDDFAKADGWGIAQYAQYTLMDTVILNARAEFWRDGKNFYVFSFPGPFDFVNAELGKPNTSFGAPAATSYGEITLGVTWKPAVPKPLTGIMIRPEIRYDSSLNGTRPFNGGKDTGAFTLAVDAVLGF